MNDALSFAKEAAAPYAKQGYTIREDAWGGDLGVKDQQAVTAQLFRGNEYGFWLATDTRGAVITVHIYDSDGKLAETEFWQKGRFAGAKITPNKTGAYYAIVTVANDTTDFPCVFLGAIRAGVVPVPSIRC